MSKWHGGKGSKQRPTDLQKYSDNWERIFAKTTGKVHQDGLKPDYNYESDNPLERPFEPKSTDQDTK